MNHSTCPAAIEARRELASVREQLSVWRDEPEPAISSPYGVTGLWVGRVEDLEAVEGELVAHLVFLDEHFA